MSQRRSLTPRAIAAIRDVERHLSRGDALAAERALPIAHLHAPEHPSTRQLAARVYQSRGRIDEAIAILSDAVRSEPDDVDLLASLGAMQVDAGQFTAAIETLRAVCERRASGSSWLELGIALDHAGRTPEALAAADAAIAIEPSNGRARLLRARCLQACGDIDAAASEYRALISGGQHVAAAWFALLDFKTITLSAPEVAALRRFATSAARSPDERCLLDFAMARVHENAGEHARALALLARANEHVTGKVRWNAQTHSAYIDRVLAAFASQQSADGASARGHEVIFIVGLPRSGSTLFEQILAAHPDIEGASELPDLPVVIAGESERRRKAFPDWVGDATAADWERLGLEYLARTARWRRQRPVFTDKAPENWQYAGAIAAMLPGARIIDCRRDALETCWSCYKQLFAPGCVGFAYAFGDLASYWRDYLRGSAHWAKILPARYLTCVYEDLIADQESTTRSLLDFCGVAFHADCLQPHLAERAIRTSSSAQVRQPLRRDTARSSRYGAALDPLRIRLGMAPWEEPEGADAG